MTSGAGTIGADDYYRAAKARLSDARALYDQGVQFGEVWAGCTYLAGRAVESLLRSFLWMSGQDQTIGHDLKKLRKEFKRQSGYPEVADAKPVVDAINDLSIVWSNNLRFCDDLKLKRLLKQSGRLNWIGGQKVKGDPLKLNAKNALQSCEVVLSYLEPTCKRRLKKK